MRTRDLPDPAPPADEALSRDEEVRLAVAAAFDILDDYVRTGDRRYVRLAIASIAGRLAL